MTPGGLSGKPLPSPQPLQAVLGDVPLVSDGSRFVCRCSPRLVPNWPSVESPGFGKLLKSDQFIH